MAETHILVVGARGAGKGALLDSVCATAGGERTDQAQASVVLAGGEVLRLRCVAADHADHALAGAAGVLSLLDAHASDASAQLQACMALLCGPAATLPAVLGISRVDLQPDWDTASTTAALARAGHSVPVVPFDARDPAQSLMLLDVLLSQIETHDLVTGSR